jgi:formylglycine-generating enzyme required for sulfatase activity
VIAVALAIFFAFVIGRSISGGRRSSRSAIKTAEIIPAQDVGTGKLPTSVAPPGAVETFEYETVTLDKDGNVISRQKKQARHFGEDLGEDVILEMVEIPGGSFTIGSPKQEEGREWTEGPQRRVTLPSFWMGKYEVTQEQWREVAKLPIVKSNIDPKLSLRSDMHDKAPVNSVSWDDAVEFCKRLSQRTGRTYRLPTEAEWEYAARAGTTTPFAFGPTITPAVANCARQNRMTVGSLGVANAFGLFDAHGNVVEWCQDVWRDNYNGLSADGSWTKEGELRSRAARGGSSGHSEIESCRSARRFYSGTHAHDFGFRVLTSTQPR